jgi:2,4-dienoyl-CoA reductase-like NADH-dependent reductase (Old Yellow Enzyme family)
MEINTNFSSTGVNGAATPPRSAPAPAMLSDRVSLTNSSALEQSLANTPASRPDMVEMARALIADPSYPSSDILSAVSRQLASGLMSDNS